MSEATPTNLPDTELDSQPIVDNLPDESLASDPIEVAPDEAPTEPVEIEGTESPVVDASGITDGATEDPTNGELEATEFPPDEFPDPDQTPEDDGADDNEENV